MAAELGRKERVVDGVRRILRKEVKKALEALNPAPDIAVDVHEVRKRFKKIRATLKLIRPVLGAKAYRRYNACFRDAGQPLRLVRDAEALLETVDALARHPSSEVPEEAFQQARDALNMRQKEVCRQVMEEQNAAGKAAEAVRPTWRRLKRRPLHGKGWSALRGGLERTYQRGLDAYAAVEAEQTSENLHEWRKRVKDFGHQLQLVRRARPEVLDELVNETHHLADVLGDDHNLALLRSLISDEGEGLGEQTRELLPLIDGRRAELQTEARQLGEIVYRQTPTALVHELNGFWTDWRSQKATAGSQTVD